MVVSINYLLILLILFAECSFTEEVNHVLDLFGCITVTGDLKISQNFGVPPPGWRLDRVTGNVHLAEHLPEGETERMFDFLKGTLIDGKLCQFLLLLELYRKIGEAKPSGY